MALDGGVVAVVPTYRPEREVLTLLGELSEQCDLIVVSDDASPCTFDRLLDDLSDIPRTEVLRHARNRGIARGLNDGLHRAQDSGAEWLLTVDQDSQLPSGYVSQLREFAEDRLSRGERLGAIGARVIGDASGDMRYPERGTDGHLITEELIQTGTLWRVEALTEFGGFDEVLAIDAVDSAACLALRQRGWVIGLHDSLHITHRIGNARVVKIGRREIMITGHSPERRATMLRNRLRLFPAEFRQSPSHAIRTIRRVTVNQSLGLLNRRERSPETH